ncbi:cytosine permease [Nonomuraea rubra]|uniref:cytosine permease n=1 Tax=Nonomuraea rubra TaxID=46180 RepID=UPI0031E87012
MAVEQNGINAIPEGERRGRPRDLFWPWAGSNLSLFGVAFGVYVVGLGLGVVPAIITGAAGYALSFLLVGLVAVGGARSGVPTMTLGRAPFGFQGNKLPTLFSYVSNVGWEIVLVTLAAQSGAEIIRRLGPGLPESGQLEAGVPPTAATAVCFAVAAVVVIAVGVYGHAMIMVVQRYLTYAFIVLTVVYLILMCAQARHRLAGEHVGRGRLGGRGHLRHDAAGPGLGQLRRRLLPLPARELQAALGGPVDDARGRAAAPGAARVRSDARRRRSHAGRGGGGQPGGGAGGGVADLVPGAVPADRRRRLPGRRDHGHLLVGAVDAGAGRAHQAALRGADRRAAHGARRLLPAVRLHQLPGHVSRRSWRSSAS